MCSGVDFVGWFIGLHGMTSMPKVGRRRFKYTKAGLAKAKRYRAALRRKKRKKKY